MVLVACRPRKQWPDFFTLSVNDMALGRARRNDGNDNSHAAPYWIGNISEELLFDKYDMETRTDSIGSNDAVVFVNPTMYSLDPTDCGPDTINKSTSAFDEEISEEQNSDTLKQLADGTLAVDKLEVLKQVFIGKRDKK